MPARRSTIPNFDRAHRCAGLGCKRTVAPKYVFCKRCWGWLPRELQVELYATFTTGTLTRRFLAAVRAAQRELAPHFEQVDLFQQAG